MQIIEFGQQLNCPIVVCLGYFGCMHAGHVQLVRLARQRAEERCAKVALFTFANNHLVVLGKSDKLVYTFDERLELYQKCGVDYVISATFDEKFRNLLSAEFVSLLNKYDLKGVVCGFDYRCGSDLADAQHLSELLLGTCEVDIVDAICQNGVKISTSLIKNLLNGNDIQAANNLLSEPFFLCGTVVHGRHIGRQIGFPTANLAVSNEKLLPHGVFKATASVGGDSFSAIINIGQKPTFNRAEDSVEAHLLGFDGDLYGKRIKIALTEFIRPIQKFDDEQQLMQQLIKDKMKVQND